jgi:hypothetical protein
LHRSPAQARYCSVCGQAIAWEALCEADIALRRSVQVNTRNAPQTPTIKFTDQASSELTFRDCMIIALMVFSSIFALTGGTIPFLFLIR